MAKTTLQDLCDISALKSMIPKEIPVQKVEQPKEKQATKQVVPVKKKSKKSPKVVTPTPDTTRNIIVANVSLKRKWTDFLMAEYLHSKGIYAQELSLHKASLIQSLGPYRYANILRLLKEKSAPKTVISHQQLGSTGRVQAMSAQKAQPTISFKSFAVDSGAVTKSGTVVTIIFDRKPLDIVIPVKLDCVPSFVNCIVSGKEVKIDEYQLYKQYNVFAKSKNYQFKVANCKRDGHKYICTLVDRCHNEQELISTVNFSVGDQIVCRVDGIREQEDHSKSLVLSNPRLYKHTESILKKPKHSSDDDVYYPNNKRPEAWYREVEGLGKHTATGPFRCSCCNRNFSARQGCKIEFRDIYFCKACADQIFKHSDKGYLRIVYTPMGNKR